ncbi:WD repeat-containing protein 26 homolog [Andrographis paniculata]|uniref:WD repeat-containing protein 26 homolog n=1 Tax=Andrographis paniculata TaxID=175694 RepID=UPI0021E8BB54|nr:WD repeat-containing protein 26 homolog [Andrographis paniculata]XP_051115569.1 WD repeat-containing protein 26 homolog [Andrographis paniculata]XP_051115570.1 WD repeat-containing protein 26 homolog [Andrographis paniculata]XP_051115571.1 WD repeat-containing protein 26 homolog [Andrographis paniculata]XP_051115572.1 WD repeat-containing protein 26 homolog [Andrographis paniculata]
MGGVEDDGPPSKRVKVSSEESRGLSNGVSVREQGTCSLSGSMARLIVSQDDEETVGSKGVIKKVELVRIISEALYSLGYSNSGARLEKESGIPLHSSLVDLFMQQIVNGQWDESVATLHDINLIDETIIKLASFVILEQKFFELLDGGKVMDALKTLRSEISPLCINDDRVRELSYFILSPARNLLDGSSGQETRVKSRKKLLEELQKLLPPTVIIPEHRLIHLVEQALDLQRDACRFHNSSVGEMSLLTDHHCGTDQIPCQTLQILNEHNDEVWFLQFSYNGKFLASSSGDGLVIVWEVKDNGQLCLKHRLSGHQKPVNYISWSQDDHQLLTCGVEEAVRRWDIASGECLHVYEKNGLGLVSCGWAVDGKSIFSGVTDKSICMWDLEGKELECWKGQKTNRIADLGITADGKELITVCKETTIMLFEWETKSEKFIEEDHPIVSFALSGDRKYLLVSLFNEELHLWNIDGHMKLVAKFIGHRRSRYVIRSCFGGLNQAFIASGSEDAQVYIWHRLSGELILTLPGHSGAVNCVSWNPSNPHMLASASDDRTIRIWGLNRVNMNSNGLHSNGKHCCNGKS